MFLKYIKNLGKIIFSTKKKGFSFLEVMISIFIFAIMMVSVSMTFASLFRNYKNTKKIQQNLENAQFAMNTMAKSLRTSSIVSPASARQTKTVVFFDYSLNRCIGYRFLGTILGADSSVDYPAAPQPQDPTSKKNWCSSQSGSFNYPSIVSSSTLIYNGNFNVVPSQASSAMGKVTISMSVCAVAGCASGDKAIIQSSVSLRDYNEVGL